jgi:CHAT domain-containing protein
MLHHRSAWPERAGEAIDLVWQALTIQRELGDLEGEGSSLATLGVLHERLGDAEQALALYLQAITVSERVRDTAVADELKTSLAERHATAYERAVPLLVRLGRPAEAFDLAERARARTFLDQLGNARVDVRGRADAGLVLQEEVLRQDLAALERELWAARVRLDVERELTLRGEVAAKRRALEDLLTRLKLSNPEYAALRTVAPLDLRGVQRQLDRQTTLLSYFVTAEATLAFVVTGDALHVERLPAPGEDVHAAVQALRSALATAGRRPAAGQPAPAQLKQLYDVLIAPVRARITTPVLGIVPHGELHYVPFAALTDGARYLGDAHTLFTLPSASVLEFIPAKRKRGPSPRALVLGQGQADGFSPLPQAELEAQAVAKLFRTRPLLAAAATETALRTGAPGAQIIHLAAHGQLDAASPLFSRIVLAPDGESDGSLELHEVYGLDLSQAHLVVLSACDTQLGPRSRGDDVVGLSRAFIYAGAPTVVATLWQVDDEATGHLMTAFYRELAAGRTAAAALQAAQAATRATYPHPYHWAAFVLSGDPSTVARPGPAARADGGGLWLVALGAAVAGAGGLVWRRRRAARHVRGRTM